MLIGYPFITFFFAVVFTALIGTVRAALLAMCLCALLGNRFAFDSNGSFLPQNTSAWIGLAFFVIASVMIIALVHALSESLMRLRVLELMAWGFPTQVHRRARALSCGCRRTVSA